MPTISRFSGIIITIHYDDHAPPHFHARCGEHEALIMISTLEVLEGDLPRNKLTIVLEWAKIHHDGLMEEWNNAIDHKELHNIPPLE